MRLSKGYFFFMGLAALLQFQTPIYAQDWFSSLSMSGLTGSHTDSSIKDSQASYGLKYETAYLEQFGYGLHLEYDTAKYSGGGSLEQSQANLNAWRLYTPSHFFAQIVLSGDLYYIENNDTTSATGTLVAFTLSSAFHALSEQFSITPSYSYSSYEKDFQSSQYDCAIRVSMNNLWDSLEYKPSQIVLSNARMTGQDSYLTHQLKWTHYLQKPDDYFSLSSISIQTTFGDRAYFVDSSSSTVYNLPDTSQSSAGLFLTFIPQKDTQWITGTGYEQFKPINSNMTYVLSYAFIQLKVGW